MNRKAFLAAIAFLGALAFFGLSVPSPFSLPLVSPAYAAPQPAPRQQQDSAPEFPSSEDGVRTVDENTDPYQEVGDPVTATGADITYTLKDSGTSHFGIDRATGQLLVGSPLNYEKESSYTVTVIATDSSDGVAEKAVTINVTNMDEPGKVTLSWKPGPNANSEPIFEAILNDPDGVNGTTTWQWERSSDNPPSGPVGGNSNIYTPGANDSGDYLRATATYTDGASGSEKTVDATVNLQLPDYLEGYTLNFDPNTSGGYSCPDGNSADICVRVSRNVTPGDDIYYPASPSYKAKDLDNPIQDRYPSLGTISYSLGGTDAPYFAIDPSNGDLLPKGPYGYEDKSTYSITIAAADLYGEEDMITLEVKRGGSSKAPVVEGPQRIEYPENGTWRVATFTGSLVDGSPSSDVSWIIGVEPGGGDGDFFDIDDDGALTFEQPPDYEDPADDNGDRTFNFSIWAYDSNPPRGQRPGQTFYSVKVIVYDVDEELEIRGPTSVNYAENGTEPVATYTVSGTEGEGTASWSLSMDEDDNFSINSDGELTFNSPPDYESFDIDENEHVFLLSISVTDGNDTEKIEPVRIEVTNVNEAPAFPAETATRNVGENTATVEDIGAPIEATDPDDGDSPTYSLTGPDAASFGIVSYSGQLQTKADVDYGTKSSYTVTVTATDQGGMSDTISVTIDVTDENDAPEFADPTATLNVHENTEADRDIGAPITATDPDNDNLTYSVEGTDAASFDIDSSTGQLKTEVALDYETKRSYSVTVKADDGNGGTDTIAVTINVTDVNEAPMFDDGATATRSVAENTGAAHSVGAPVAATDPEADTLTYSSSGRDAAIFDINTTTGQLQTKAALDFETKSTYTVTVSVRDSKDSSGTAGTAADNTTTVTINVDNVDEDGTVTLSPGQPQVDTALTATLTDLDGAVSVTAWQWARADTSTGDFADIVGGTAASYTPVADDLTKYLRATATYTDPQGPGKSADAVADNAVDPAPLINTDPAFSADTATRSVVENTEAGENIGLPVTATDDNTGDTLTYTLDGIDAADFAIDTASGQITVGASTTLDHETKPTYTVTVSVRDSEDSNGGPDTIEDDTITVTINVTDVDEDGTVTLSSDTPQIGTALTATLTDPDGTVSGETWQWAKADSATGAFADIANATAESYTPADDDLSKFLKATVSYTDGEDSGKSAYKVSANPVNAAPEFSEENATRSVDENTEAGHAIGTPVTATDATTVTYTLGGTDAASFSIVSGTGQLLTKAELDFEDKSSYDVTVIATDTSGATASISVTITVNNLDEAGSVKLTLLQPQVGTEQTATLDDPDGTLSRVSWQWARGDSATGSFTNVSSGTDPGSYTPVAADVGKLLRATATYDDGHGAGKTANAVSTHAVQAAPATNDEPVFSEDSASRSVAENAVPGTDIGTPVTASDANSDTLTYSLGGDAAASFDILPGTGQLQTKAALDFESDKKSYTVVVTATDPSGTLDTIMVTITVTNVDEAGTVTLSNVQPQVGTELTAMLEDTDGDPTSVTWQWGRGDTPDGSFDNISSGPSYTPVAADVGKFLQATATYTDPQGPDKTAHGVSTHAVQAAPDGPNSAPVFSSNTAIRSVAEDAIEGSNIGTPVIATDAANDTLTYSLAETDTAPLSIVQESGQLQTTAELDYETTPSYTVTVTATDPSGLVGSITVTISVGNVDEPGTVSISPSQFQVGTELTASLTDPDGTISGVTWQWDKADTDDTYSNVGSSASYTPTAADVDKFLRATATYTDTEGSDKSAESVSDSAVEAAPPTNEAPEFPATTATRTVAENTAAGTNFGTAVTATDSVGDTLTYSLGGTDAGSFSIVETSGQLQTKAELDFESKSSYDVTVTATDASGAAVSIPVTITVNNVEEAGTVTLTSLQPQVDTPFTAGLEDPDKNPSRVSWQWARGDSPTGSFTNVSSGADPGSYTPVAADLNKYLRATATYDDGHGAGKTASAVSTNSVRAAPAANSPPVFSEATASRSVPENTDVGQDIDTPVTATDANSDTLTYSLGGDAAASFDILPGTGQLQTKAALDFESDKKSYTVVVTATDPSGTLDTIMVTITVTNVDEAGTVTLSNVQPQVGTELTAMLEDTDGDPTSVTWQWGRGDTPDGSFDNISSGASYTPAAADVGKFLQATATYTDPQGPGKTARGVSVNAVQTVPDGPNSAPVFSAGNAIRSVAENAITGANIGTPVKATDPEGDTLTYALSGTDAALFGIVDVSGQLQTKGPLNYETKNSYSVVVTATDPSGLVGSITVTINVDNVDEPGTVSISPAQFQVGTELTASLTDPDGTISGVTWQWARDDTNGAFADVSSGATYTPAAADEGKYLKATASYSDPQGSGKSADAVSANAVQAAPIVNVKSAFSAATATRTVAENTAAGQDIGAPVTATDGNTSDTLTYTLGGTEAASFDLVASTGQLQTKDALDFEDKASYTVTVSVRDSKDADGNADTSTDDSITVTITVTDVNEPPEFPSSETGARTVPENTPANTDIGNPVAATDPDSNTLTYSLEGTDAALFDIDSSTGQLKTKDALDFEVKPTLSVTVKADDSNGGTGTITVTITVTDENDAPAFSDETDTRTIPENTASGQNIGSPVAATDQDSGNTLTYTLGGEDADSFTVISTSGQLQTKAELDHETKPTYTVTVSVRDNKGDDGSADTATDNTIVVTINVTDVNESPVVADTPNANYAENDTGPVATYTATDPDKDTTITWLLEGDDKDDFDISQSGVLTFKTSPDYEVPADGNTDNVYMLTIKASDGEADHPLSVTVTVINVDEPGAVRLTSFYPQVGAELTATLSDPDGDPSGVTWAWGSSSNRDSDTWTTISGADAKAYTPVEGDMGKYLRVTASYTDPEGPGKRAHSETTDPVRAAPVNNAAPTFSTDTDTRSVAENTPAGAKHRRPGDGYRHRRRRQPYLLAGRRRWRVFRYCPDLRAVADQSCLGL